jgi:23S rRNA pseudouridine2605 synthase
MSSVEEARKNRRIGLARALSKLGYCSRSNAAELIRAGRVKLNGTIRLDPGTPVTGASARISVDGRVVETAQSLYYMLNKPRGAVTTASDEKGRDTVYKFLDAQFGGESQRKLFPWVAPIGRLDKASEGLLLLTNDSEWAARITAPETHLEKTYHVQVTTVADDAFVRELLRGVTTEDGEVLRARQVSCLRAGEKNCWLEIILDEGKNRQIRRMMEAGGVEVLRLIRVAIGPLRLGKLAKGCCRTLTVVEKQLLDETLRCL